MTARLDTVRPERRVQERSRRPAGARPHERPRRPTPSLALAAVGTAFALGACAVTPPAERGRAAPDASTLASTDIPSGAPADAAEGAPTVAATNAPGKAPASAPRGGSTEPVLGAASVTEPTLYAELGGASGVEALSERLIREIATDERIRGHYRDTDIGRFHRMMQEQMCERTGGGCTYTGDDMRRTHGGMNITPVEFNAIVEALMRAMDALELPVATQNRLLALYAPMYHDIVDR